MYDPELVLNSFRPSGGSSVRRSQSQWWLLLHESQCSLPVIYNYELSFNFSLLYVEGNMLLSWVSGPDSIGRG